MSAGLSSPNPLPRLAGGRNDAIDLFRAVTVLVMIVVNDWASVAGLPAWARHMPADADAMSFVDAVFPAFLFIVGLSIPFALQQRFSAGQPAATVRHVVQRAGALVLLGFFMVNAEELANPSALPVPPALWALGSYAGAFLLWGSLQGGPALAARWRWLGAALLAVLALVYRSGDAHAPWMQPHWWGILGLIGWAYLLASAAYLGARGRLAPLALLLLLCVGYFIAGSAVPAASPYAVLLGQGGHASHTAIVLAGCMTARLLFDERRAHTVAALVFAVALALLAMLLQPGWKISKIYATPSWALYSAAACVVVLVALRFALQRLPGLRTRLAAWLAPVAAHPLLAYLIPFVVEALCQLAGVARPALLRQAPLGIAIALLYALAVLTATRWLVARGVRLRL